jgi:hypothetical protein
MIFDDLRQAPSEGDTAISVRFFKPLEKFTADDRKQLLRRLAAYMRDHSRLKRPKRRRKVAK